MKTNILSQESQIKKHLQKGVPITPMSALKLYGCFRLSARIFRLKKQGMNIKTKMVEQNGKRFAQYYL